MRNSMNAEEVAVGWWPGDARYERAAFYAYAHPARDGFADGDVAPDEARWEPALGEFVLDWDDVRDASDPAAHALEFARAAARHGCAVCDWEPALLASVDSYPPPVV
jgi:hypothetical protein